MQSEKLHAKGHLGSPLHAKPPRGSVHPPAVDKRRDMYRQSVAPPQDWKGVVQTALRAGFQVVRGSACLLRGPFWIETPVGYTHLAAGRAAPKASCIPAGRSPSGGASPNAAAPAEPRTMNPKLRILRHKKVRTNSRHERLRQFAAGRKEPSVNRSGKGGNRSHVSQQTEEHRGSGGR